MERYDYLSAVKDDVRAYIKDNDLLKDGWQDNRDEIEEKLNDDLWCEDSVTGNASGSYTFNAWQAEEYLVHNLDLLFEAMEEFSCDFKELQRGAEYADVTIRCYLLGQAISEVLDEFMDKSE